MLSLTINQLWKLLLETLPPLETRLTMQWVVSANGCKVVNKNGTYHFSGHSETHLLQYPA